MATNAQNILQLVCFNHVSLTPKSISYILHYVWSPYQTAYKLVLQVRRVIINIIKSLSIDNILLSFFLHIITYLDSIDNILLKFIFTLIKCVMKVCT